MKTIITHFYNEEFLLPLWLTHHKTMFDHGVLIDYGSSDRSIEIIKEICPTWEIVNSEHEFFDHLLCDDEVKKIENRIEGWRISITVTEFVVGNLNSLFIESSENINWYLPVVIFTGYQPDGYVDNTKPLWNQMSTGIPPHVDKAHRSLHNYGGIFYPGGRHFWGDVCNTQEAMIFKYSSCLIGSEMIKRRLQVQDKVSQSDKNLGVAEHHVYSKGGGLTVNTLYQFYKENVLTKNPVDCSEYIAKLTPKLKKVDDSINVYVTKNGWDYRLNSWGWVGGKYDAANKSEGFHGILQQWWNYYGNQKSDWLLITEGSAVKDKFQIDYPNYNFKTLDAYFDDSDIKIDLCTPNIINNLLQKFDVIICQATLEHLFDPVTFLRNISDLLKKDGIILIHTHVPKFHYHPWPRDYLRYHPDWFLDAEQYINGLHLVELATSEYHIFAAFKKL